jgi:nucleotide-binding universal stress UspA family protein
MVKRYARVLAAVDFSDAARGAFEYALALSVRDGAELMAVHAVPLDQAFGWHADERLALIAGLRQRAEQARVAFTDRVQQGDAAKIVLLHARAVRPDVIVVGTHQRSGFDRLRVGSVAERVAAKATVPVLLVPRGVQPGAVGPFRHVAVAVDFSPGSDRAVDLALALARRPDDRITLLHVVPGFAAADVPPNLSRYSVSEYDARMVRDARRRLQLAVAATRPTRAAIHTRVLRGTTTTEISRVVAGIGADLLVVGATSRGVVSRTLFGTTAGRLLKATRVPMLAVPDLRQVVTPADRAARRLAA